MGAFIGNGTKFTFTDASGAVSTLGEVLSIDGPDAERETVEYHPLGSTQPWRQFFIGDGDGGAYTLEYAYDNSSSNNAQLALNQLLSNSTLVNFSIVYNSTMESESFTGYVTGISRPVSRNEIITGSLSIKVSSGPGFVTST